MSPRLGRSNPAADHARARELAASRLDDELASGDAAWLDAHLAGCAECAGVAAAYDEQRLAFRALRDIPVEAPRDLWARTAAAIEAEGPASRRRRGWSRSMRPAPLSGAWRLALAPVAAIVVVAVVVGSGLFGGTFPGSARPTPIQLAAADVQVLTRDRDGNIQILTRPVGPVCPDGSQGCAAQPTFAVTTLSGLSGTSDLNGTLSPAHDRMVVITSGSGGEGVYILPVATTAPVPSASPAPATASTPATSTASPATTPAPTPATTPAPPSTTPASPSPTTGPDISPSASPASPPASPTPSGSADTTASPSPATAAPSSPSPSAVTAATDAIQIASGVSVVGPVQYSPDGTHVAFSARPADASTGPDVYVWSAGEPEATAITTDHASWLAAWTADGLLVSRVANGTPGTYLVDPVTAQSTAVGDGPIWLPSLAPSGQVAAWWDGTVKQGADGTSWQPDTGQLVLGAWPPAAGGAAPQVLAQDPLSGWQVRWDDTGSVVAVWLAGTDAGDEGRLSLYPVNSANGRADLAHPKFDPEPAEPGFSLRSGRLAWTTPGAGNGQMLQVFAWSGSTSQHFEVPAEQGSTVVP
jgi:hypothetical protein